MTEALKVAVVDEVRSELEKVDSDPDNQSEEEVVDVSKFEIRADQQVSRPPSVLEIKEGQRPSIIASRGDISTVIGKAKSKKTFLVTLLVAVVLKGAIANIRGNLLSSKRRVLYFDTEMSNYHVYRVSQRIARLVNDDFTLHPEDITIFALRELRPDERVAVIKQEIEKRINLFYYQRYIPYLLYCLVFLLSKKQTLITPLCRETRIQETNLNNSIV